MRCLGCFYEPCVYVLHLSVAFRRGVCFWTEWDVLDLNRISYLGGSYA